MTRPHHNGFRILFACVALCALLFMVGCDGDDDDGSSAGGSSATTGDVTVTLSDPPTCRVPFGTYREVWVTVTGVRAHLSNNGGPDDSGWVDILDLREAPKQINLLGSPDATCILTTLGINEEGMPAGDYQQIRLHLKANDDTPTPEEEATNVCREVDGFNCVRVADDTLHLLLLSSQANTGLKIPPGQIEGGAIRLEGDQPADLHIDFDACRSVVVQGDGQYRLKPTLRATKLVDPTASISGRVVVDNNDTTITLVENALILAERPDTENTDIDRVILQTLSDAEGTFNLCPLPGDDPYDIVVAAVDETTVTAYNTTVTFGVPVGIDMGDIPLTPGATGPATIMGEVTTSDGPGKPPGADIALSALQRATIDGISRLVTIPLLQDSTANVATEDDPVECPLQTQCATYNLRVPASNPVVGIFDSVAYAEPTEGAVFYTVDAQAFSPGGGDETCVPSRQMTDQDSMDPSQPLAVTGDMTTTAMTLLFMDCR